MASAARPVEAAKSSATVAAREPAAHESAPVVSSPLTRSSPQPPDGFALETLAPQPGADIRTRRQRLAASAQRGALDELGSAGVLGGGGDAIVLIGRNHERTFTERLQAWRGAIPNAAGRVSLLDLGSTDGTWAASEAANIPGVQVQGGLMRAMSAIEAAVLSADAERVLVVDLDTAVTDLGRRLLAALAAGADVALPAGAAPGAIALSARAVSAHPLGDHADIDVWTQAHQLQLAVLGHSELPRPETALVPRVAGWRPPSPWRRVAAGAWRAALRALPLGG